MNVVSEMNWMFQSSSERDETGGHTILTISNHLKRVNDLLTAQYADIIWSGLAGNSVFTAL